MSRLSPIHFYNDRILPRAVDKALGGAAFAKLRVRATEGLRGRVLEVGFGSGLNVAHYPSAVERVLAVDPATTGRTLAAKRVAASPVPVEYVGLDGQDLPLGDGTVDCVLTTWTLCSIPDLARALAEMRRVLRPGGVLHFLEHGRSPDPAVARWQDRLTPIQRHLFGGCHLNRPIRTDITDAGFEIARIDNFYLRGPRPFGYMYEGRATTS